MTLVFDLRNAPNGLFSESRPEAPFAHSEQKWRELKLWEVVRGLSGNGTLLYLDDGRTRFQLWPEGEEYRPISDEDLVFSEIDDELSIGWDERPGPEDLDNGNPLGLSSLDLELADGNVWKISQIRDPGGTRLPRDLVRDRKTGNLLTPLKREYQDLWDETEYWFDLFWQSLEGNVKTFSYERALKFATEVLSLRYRFCDAVQSALRVIDSVNVEKIIFIATGFDQVYEILKDKAQKKSP